MKQDCIHSQQSDAVLNLNRIAKYSAERFVQLRGTEVRKSFSNERFFFKDKPDISVSASHK